MILSHLYESIILHLRVRFSNVIERSKGMANSTYKWNSICSNHYQNCKKLVNHILAVRRGGMEFNTYYNVVLAIGDNSMRCTSYTILSLTAEKGRTRAWPKNRPWVRLTLERVIISNSWILFIIYIIKYCMDHLNSLKESSSSTIKGIIISEHHIPYTFEDPITFR